MFPMTLSHFPDCTAIVQYYEFHVLSYHHITRNWCGHEKCYPKLWNWKNFNMSRYNIMGIENESRFCAALYSTRKNGRKAGRFKMDTKWSDCGGFERLAGLESDVLLLKCWSLTASSPLLELLFISISQGWLMESEKQLWGIETFKVSYINQSGIGFITPCINTKCLIE